MKAKSPPRANHPICPYLLTVGLFAIAISHIFWPEIEGYLALIVGIAWVWSIGDDIRIHFPSDRIPEL